MVTSLFFKTGKLYETLFDLYSLAFRKEYQTLQEKLIDLKNIKPKTLEITDKYCLDETSLELQSKIIKEKQKEKEENEKDKDDKNDNSINRNTKNNLHCNKANINYSYQNSILYKLL